MFDLYEQVYAWDNLLSAYGKASKGKRGKAAAAEFEVDLADHLLGLSKELQARTYRPGVYRSFHIEDPKRRLISAAAFRDRVVHHALVNVIEPRFEKSFISDSYANRKGKGTHAAVNRCQQLSRRYEYVLRLDVRQHFPSIDHDILLEEIRCNVRDERVLWLCRVILDSGIDILFEEYDMVFFPGDILFAVNRSRGLPIGNLTSQFWSNCYLNRFDHFVKRTLRCRGYLRYVDDILLFSNDKTQLWNWRQEIIQRLAGLRLTIHARAAQVQPVGVGVPWLGFVVYPTHRRLKRRNVLGYRRRLAELERRFREGNVRLQDLSSSIRGWVNHVRYGDTWGLRGTVLAAVTLETSKTRRVRVTTRLPRRSGRESP